MGTAWTEKHTKTHTQKNHVEKMLRKVPILALFFGYSFAAPSTCSQNSLQLCDTAYTSICQKYLPLCENSIDCKLEIEGLYQDALATIDETESCECQQISCSDWDNMQGMFLCDSYACVDAEEQESQLQIYEAAARQYLQFQDEASMETAIQEASSLQGNDGDHLLLLLLIIHKNNQNGLLKFIILKKIGFLENSSGIVKLIVLKKLFGDSDTILKLWILKKIANNNNDDGI